MNMFDGTESRVCPAWHLKKVNCFSMNDVVVVGRIKIWVRSGYVDVRCCFIGHCERCVLGRRSI